MPAALISIAALLFGVLGSPGTVALDTSRLSEPGHSLRVAAGQAPDCAIDLADPNESDPEVARPIDSSSPLFVGGAWIARAEGHAHVASVARLTRAARGPPTA